MGTSPAAKPAEGSRARSRHVRPPFRLPLAAVPAPRASPGLRGRASPSPFRSNSQPQRPAHRGLDLRFPDDWWLDSVLSAMFVPALTGDVCVHFIFLW